MNLETFEEEHIWTHRDYVNVVRFSPDGKWALSGSNDFYHRFFDSKSGELVKSVLSGEVYFMDYSKNDILLIGTVSRTKIYDLKSGQIPDAAKSIIVHDHISNKTLLSPKTNSFVVTANLRGPIGSVHRYKWKKEEREEGYHLEFGDFRGKRIGDVAISPNEKWILIGVKDDLTCFFDIETGEQAGCLGNEKSAKRIAFSKDGKYIMTASFDSMIRVYKWQPNSSCDLNP